MKKILLLAMALISVTSLAHAGLEDYQCGKVLRIEETPTTSDVVIKSLRIVLTKEGETYKTKIKLAKFAMTNKFKLCRNNYSGEFAILEK